MPHGKKSNKKQTTPKKKGPKCSIPQVAAASPTSVCDARAGGSAASKKSSSSSTRCSSDSTLQAKESIYVRYKESTQRIKDALQSMVPPEIFQHDSVHSLMEATDYIVEHDVEVNNALLSDLKLSIRVRKRFAEDKYGGGDEGHSHFIAVLVCCWSCLSPRRQPRMRAAAPVAPDGNDDTDVTVLCNRFEGLSSEFGEEDDGDDEKDLPNEPQPRPLETTPSRLTLQELIDGNDRTNVLLFLFTLDELMGRSALRFAQLKESSITIRLEGRPDSAIVKDMMEASVAANFAIQQVEALEEAFYKDNPHLNTIYRALASLVLVERVRDLTCIVTQKSPLADQFFEKHAIEFLCDAVECAFRHPSDVHNKSKSLVAAFQEQWQIPDDTPVPVDNGQGGMTVETVFEGVKLVVQLEAPLYYEQSDDLCSIAATLGTTSHSWLSSPHIGSNRSITHTIRNLQHLSHLITESSGRLLLPPRYFGPCWGDRMEPASRIPMDMDSLLMGDIMPSLVNMSHEAYLSNFTIFQDEFFCCFVQLRAFAKHPARPLSWSLAFSIHTILTSIFEVQGLDHFDFLSETALSSFERYFEQLFWADETHKAAIIQRPLMDSINEIFSRNIMVLPLVSDSMEQTTEQKMLSSWNPYCAGAFLSYVAFFGNLMGGASVVDSVGQLRITLHMFHALKQVGAIAPGQIKLLDSIFEMFEDSQSIWGGQLPVPGRFQTRFWISMGMTEEWARRMHGRQWKGKPMQVIPHRAEIPNKPEHLSKSFCRLGLFEAFNEADHDTTSKLLRPKHGAVSQFATRTHRALCAMSEEEQLLATNLISLGCILNQFYIKLFVDWGWMPLVDTIIGLTPNKVRGGAPEDALKFQFMHHLFSQRILGPLDSGDSVMAARCAKFMDRYYNGLSLDYVHWFLPKEPREEE